MYNWDSPWEECMLVGTWSATDNWSSFCFLLPVGVLFLRFCPAQVSLMLSWPGLTVLLLERDTSITKQVVHPRVIQHPEKWFQTLWSCARQKFTSGTSHWWGQMFDFRRYTRLSLRVISSLQRRLQSLSLGMNPICNAELCCPHDNIVEIRLCDECTKLILLIFSSVACLSPFNDWSCKFVDRPQNVWSSNSCQVRAFSDNLWANFWQFTHWSKLRLSWNEDHSSMQGLETLYSCSVFLLANSHYLSTYFLSMSFHVVGPRSRLCVSCSHPGNFSVVPPEKRNPNTSVDRSIIVSSGSHSRCVHPKDTWSRNDVGSSRSTFFINFPPSCASLQPFWCQPHIPTEIITFSDEQTCIPNLVSFSNPNSNKTSSNCLSHNNPANGWPCKFRSRGTKIFNVCPGFRSFMSWKTYPYVWTFWLWNSGQSGSVLQFYLSAGRYWVSCLSVTIW